jgi:hypothetical protein
MCLTCKSPTLCRHIETLKYSIQAEFCLDGAEDGRAGPVKPPNRVPEPVWKKAARAE